MKVVLHHARGAFLNIFEPKQYNGTGDARCNGNFILDPTKQKAELDKVLAAIQQVATEKWGAKAIDVLKTLKAKGDLCIHDGATKAEYDGFEGMVFISASNKGRPAVVAKRKFNGKAVGLDQAGNTYIDGVRTDVGFPVTVPYSGCYVNVSIDVWVQDNAYGKRVNAKLLAVQFDDDGPAFSGGEGFSEADFDDTSEEGGAAGGGDFFGGGSQPSEPASTSFF